MQAALHDLPRLLKLLADPTRLRMLGLLERHELSVGELSRALGMAQSRVSNHLRLLRESHLLAERHAGTSTFLQLVRPGNGSGLSGRLWSALADELQELPEHAADLARLDGVLAERRERGADFFDRLAGHWDKIAGEFQTGVARQRAAVHLLPRESVLADLGCGTGYMGRALAGRCSRLVCVDGSGGMLEEAQRRLGDRIGETRIEYRQGELDALPIQDAELDGAVAGMVLHHLPDLDRPLAEILRTLKPGASAAVLELAPHREEWMRSELGDRHLGLEPADVMAAFARVGFEDVALDPVEDRYRPRRSPLEAGGDETVSLSLYIVRGRAPRA
jgi:ArsR family transcriptional regulator